jgi:hypothetical protein
MRSAEPTGTTRTTAEKRMKAFDAPRRAAAKRGRMRNRDQAGVRAPAYGR